MRLRSLLPAAALLLASSVAAHAGIITALASTPTKVSTGWAYTYNVSLTQQIDPAGTNTYPSFGTLYDFGTVVGNTLSASTGLLSTSFVFTFSATSTPAAYQTVPTDDASLTNIRFTYTGSTGYIDSGAATTTQNSGYTVLADGASNLGTFTVISPYGPNTRFASFDGQDFKTSNNLVEGLVGSAAVPSPVPEPSSLALLGTGLLGAVGVVRRRMKA